MKKITCQVPDDVAGYLADEAEDEDRTLSRHASRVLRQYVEDRRADEDLEP